MIFKLRLAGFAVFECHERLWHGEDDRIAIAKGGWKSPRFWNRVIRTYAKLIRKFFALDHADVIFVAYPGYLDVYIAKILSWIHGTALVWDICMSLYVLAIERELGKYSAILPPLIEFIEKVALRLPDKVIADTNEYKNFFIQHYGIDAGKFWLLPFGANTNLFSPAPLRANPTQGFVVLYYGGFVPNHGTPLIIKAARVLQDYSSIIFNMIGEGPEKNECKQLADEFRLKNIAFLDWMDPTLLVEEIRRADVCLGSFANTPHGALTIQNKIFECIACAKPVITGDSPAVREVFSHKENIYLVPRDDAQGIAEAILELFNNARLRQSIANAGNQLFNQNFTDRAIAATLKEYMHELLAQHQT